MIEKVLLITVIVTNLLLVIFSYRYCGKLNTSSLDFIQAKHIPIFPHSFSSSIAIQINNMGLYI